MNSAIARETEIKGWRREKKVALIAANNPTWEDLAAEWGKPAAMRKADSLRLRSGQALRAKRPFGMTKDAVERSAWAFLLPAKGRSSRGRRRLQFSNSRYNLERQRSLFKDILMSWASKVAKPYRIDHGKKFRLKDFDPGDTAGLHSKDHQSKDHAEELLARGIAALAELQDKLYAQDRWGVLVIFQGMDAAGKDGLVKHVMSGLNPEGCQVDSFKTPSDEELNHDYLWRSMQRIPERGRIGIFNRSYYEEVLIVRVHKEIFAKERIPADLVTKDIWKDRYQDVNAFERYLDRNGILVRKFFLNLSKKEQKQRFLDRLDQPNKNWKLSSSDVGERQYWGDYMTAYEEMVVNTATKHAPWYVVPADNKWFTRVVVAAAIVEALEELNLAYPKVDAAKRKELKAAKALLLGEKKP